MHEAKDVERWEKIIALADEFGAEGLIADRESDTAEISAWTAREPVLVQILNEWKIEPGEDGTPRLDDEIRGAIWEEMIRRVPLTDEEKQAIVADWRHRDVLHALDYAVETGRAVRHSDGGYTFLKQS